MGNKEGFDQCGKGVEVIRLGFTNSNLTRTFYKNYPVDFEYLKLNMWIKIIHDDSCWVYKWNIPTSKGLSCKCKPLKSREEYLGEIEKVKAYCVGVNERLGTGFTVQKEVNPK